MALPVPEAGHGVIYAFSLVHHVHKKNMKPAME